jgi:SAM-dependent methyltransferase
MYAEFEVHRTMIRDRVRTEAFRRAINSVVRRGDIVLDVGAGSGILSVFAARAGAARVYAVERTAIAALAEQLAAANDVGEIVTVIHGDVMDIELPEQVDVIVSEWLGGFGIDEGMLAPVIAARDRWLKPGGVMISRSATAWTALVYDRYLADTIEFLREDPFGLKLEVLAEMTVNAIIYSGTFRHLAADDLRSEPRQLWTTNTDRVALEQAQAAHQAETLLPVHDRGTVNARRPRQSQDRPGSSDRDMDKLGDRDARRRMGGARRAVSLGGDRRLSNLRSLRGSPARRAGRPVTPGVPPGHVGPAACGSRRPSHGALTHPSTSAWHGSCCVDAGVSTG